MLHLVGNISKGIYQYRVWPGQLNQLMGRTIGETESLQEQEYFLFSRTSTLTLEVKQPLILLPRVS